MIHEVTGPAFAGKSTFLREKARSLVAEKKACLFLVPEQQTAASEADLFAFCGNRAGEYLEVLNFQRLPNRIFREIGSLAQGSADNTRKALFLSRLIQTQSAEGSLFCSKAHSAEFIAELLSFFTELVRGGISALHLEALAQTPELQKEPRLCKKLLELSGLFAAYDSALRENGGALDEQTRLCEVLDRHPECTFFEGKTVLLDGFYDFTAPEYALIERAAKSADAVYLSLLSDEGEEELFTKSRQAVRKLFARCPELFGEQILLSPKPDSEHTDFCFLCEHILSNPASPFPSAPEHLSLTECETPYEEVLYALREIYLLHTKNNTPFDECAVVFRDSALYSPLLRQLADSYGIPLYTGETCKLIFSELAEFFLAAASLAAGEPRQQALISLLKTGLLPLSEADAFSWERYLCVWDLSGEALLREKDYTESPNGLTDVLSASMEDALLAELEAINEARKKTVSALRSLRAAFRRAPTFAQKTQALLEFADQTELCNKVSERLFTLRKSGAFSEAGVQEGLFDAAKNALEALGALEGECTAEEFGESLKLAFSTLSVGALPSSPDALCAGEISFLRLKKLRHLFVLGLNADVFPAPEAPTPLLSERERNRLLSVQGDLALLSGESFDLQEYFYFYIAASTPTLSLSLSYHKKAFSGAVARASTLLERVRFLFPCAETRSFDAARALPLTRAELLSYLCRHRESQDAFTGGARALYAQESARLPLTPGEEAQVRDHVPPIPPSDYRPISQGQLETFSECPYRYFLRYRLRLSEVPRADLSTNSELGVRTHAILEDFFRAVSSGELPREALSDERLVGFLQESAAHYDHERERRGLKLDAYQRGLNDVRFASLVNLVRSEARTLTNSSYFPKFTETSLREILPEPYSISFGEEAPILLSGKVDRIDLSRTEDGAFFARVIDYKTKKHPFSQDDLQNGLNTQIILYLAALSEKGIRDGNQTLRILPGGAFYLQTLLPPMSKELFPKEKDYESARFSFARTGISVENSPGSDKSSVSEEEFKGLQRLLKETVRTVAHGIRSGNCARSPLDKPDTLREDASPSSCKFCAYRPVCRFDNTGVRPYQTLSDCPGAGTAQKGDGEDD